MRGGIQSGNLYAIASPSGANLQVEPPAQPEKVSGLRELP
jgi:hypothetical protein